MNQQSHCTRSMSPSSKTFPAAGLMPAIALGLSVAVGNGIGRFAYALLLPSMRAELQLTYAEAGWLNTANALGYVAGALSSLLLLRKRSAREIFVAGLVLCVIGIAATGLARSLLWISAMRFASGAGAAWVFTCGGALVQRIYHDSPTMKAPATGLFFGSAGVGIVLSAVLVVPLLSLAGEGAWQVSWVVLGVVAALLATCSVIVARAAEPLNHAERAGSVEPLDLRGLHPCLWSYFCIAAGYIGYMTFVFAWMRTEHHSASTSAGIWVLLGVCISLSPWVWRDALRSWDACKTLAWSSAATLSGVLFCILDSSMWSLIASATAFGLGVFICPAAVSLLISQSFSPHARARAMALFTTIFALGQAMGPVVAGALADRYGLASVLWLSAALLLVATGLPLVRRPRPDECTNDR